MKTNLSIYDRVKIGTSGWSFPDWRGVFYPQNFYARRPGYKPRELRYYAQFFDTVEINNTFYRCPEPRFTTMWLKDVADKHGFRFTLKLWQRFTHDITPWTDHDADVRQFKDGIRPLAQAGKLGAVLLQYPWSFTRTEQNFNRMNQALDTFGEFPLVVEVRHATWDTAEFVDWLRMRRVGFCNIDEPRTNRDITETNYLTGPVAYYRFHGRNAKAWFDPDAERDDKYDYLYTLPELEPWIEKIKQTAPKAEQIYVMANNHYRGQAPANALEMRAALSGAKVKAPVTLVETFPDLKSMVIETTGMPGEMF
jgi:uncharacterized protein YecE (DUF72 family)